MIGILSKHVDKVFLDKLKPYVMIEDNLDLDVDGLFVDWVAKTPVNEDAWMKQASLLQKYIKEVPIVIFDRYFSLSAKEVEWVKKFNVKLFEPALNSGRFEFEYLPEWITNFETVLEKEDEEDRIYDVVYSYHNIEYQLKEFDSWFKDYARLFPDKKVAYSTFKITDFKKEDYKDNGLIFLEHHHPIFNEGKFTVAIDQLQSYQMGYISPIVFYAMNLGCLPLLPKKHKYFHGMFKGLIVSDIKEMDYYVSLYGRVKDVLIEEIFDRIKTEWSEFTVDHASQIIGNCL